MTVQDFIVIYNETFKYVEKNYGRKQVDDLWAAISEEWCTHLRSLVAEKGLQGMNEYWGGDTGTLSREKAFYDISLKDGVFSIVMDACPSVNEIRERGFEVYTDYCEHCVALYGPVVADYGFELKSYIEREAVTDIPTGKCRLIARKAEENA